MNGLQHKKLSAAIVTCAGLALAYTPQASALVMDYNGTGGAVPPSGTSGEFTNTINVADDLLITDVSLTLNDFSHTWTGDILATLTLDGGPSIELFGAPGSLGPSVDADGTYTFADGGLAGFLTSGNPIPEGTYAPNDPFSAFAGLSSLGDWTLSLNDQFGGDSGSLGSWSLTIEGNPVPEPGTLGLFGLSLMGLCYARRKTKA